MKWRFCGIQKQSSDYLSLRSELRNLDCLLRANITRYSTTCREFRKCLSRFDPIGIISAFANWLRCILQKVIKQIFPTAYRESTPRLCTSTNQTCSFTVLKDVCGNRNPKSSDMFEGVLLHLQTLARKNIADQNWVLCLFFVFLVTRNSTHFWAQVSICLRPFKRNDQKLCHNSFSGVILLLDHKSTSSGNTWGPLRWIFKIGRSKLCFQTRIPLCYCFWRWKTLCWCQPGNDTQLSEKPHFRKRVSMTSIVSKEQPVDVHRASSNRSLEEFGNDSSTRQIKACLLSWELKQRRLVTRNLNPADQESWTLLTMVPEICIHASCNSYW